MVSKSKKEERKKTVEERKRFAKAYLQAVYNRGERLECAEDIETTLDEYAQSLGEPDYFECLWEAELRDLLDSVRNPDSKHLPSSSTKSTASGFKLPPSPPDTQSETTQDKDPPMIGDPNVSGPKQSRSDQRAQVAFHQ